MNHLAPFLLTNLLLDLLRESAPSRIVTVSSEARRGARIDFEDLQSERRYRAFKVYGMTKLANILFTYELAERLEGTGVVANCLTLVASIPTSPTATAPSGPCSSGRSSPLCAPRSRGQTPRLPRVLARSRKHDREIPDRQEGRLLLRRAPRRSGAKKVVGGQREAHQPRGRVIEFGGLGKSVPRRRLIKGEGEDRLMGRKGGIEVEDLVREFRKGPRAVDGISLRVEPGEVYGFLGPNGAGKSTTVLMLTTLLPPTSGTARVAGYDIVEEGPQVRASSGAALQEAALDQFLTGRDHLRLQGALHGLPRAERKKRSAELLERVGLSEAADRKVRGYSGGMKRRLDLALALVHRPSILFLTSRLRAWIPRAAARCGPR